MSTWWDAAKAVKNLLFEGMTFANDAGKAFNDWGKELLKYGGELAVKWATGIVNGTMDTIDMAWDATAHIADFWAEMAWIDTNFAGSEWGLDMLNKRVHEWTKQMRDMSKTKIGETVIGGLISDGVWLAGEIVAPAWIINKWIKGIKIGKEAANSLKKSPEVMTKIRSLMETAQKTGKAVEQSQVDEILQSYSIWTKWKVLQNASRVAVKAPDKTQLIDLIKNSPDLSKSEMLSKWPKLMKTITTVGPGGVVALLNQIDRLDEQEFQEFMQSQSDGATEVAPQQPTKEAPNDGGITMPEADTKDVPVNKPDRFLSEVEPTTIADKKKELELLKEKKAWDLNMATSVVDLMKGLGVESKAEARKLIFEKMTSRPYTASAEDNIQLKQLIEEAFSKGTLPDYFPSLKR